MNSGEIPLALRKINNGKFIFSGTIYMSKKDFKNLKMGIVEANFILIDKKDKSIWIERGFEEDRKFPLCRRKLKSYETIMLGVPKTIIEFGIEKFIGATIIEACTYHGTYGEGGPGFFGLSCDTKQGIFYLIFTVWCSGEYSMIDDRVIECHPKYNNQYNPWYLWDDSGIITDIGNILSGTVVKNIELLDSECRIILQFNDDTEHKMFFYKYNEKLSPMGGIEQPRKEAFTTGVIADYLLVTYKGTHLQV